MNEPVLVASSEEVYRDGAAASPPASANERREAPLALDTGGPPAQAERRTRPRWRRAFKMARPALVAMRWRKPCRFARFRLFG